MLSCTLGINYKLTIEINSKTLEDILHFKTSNIQPVFHPLCENDKIHLSHLHANLFFSLINVKITCAPKYCSKIKFYDVSSVRF